MASGPTVVVRVLGDLKNLSSSFKDAQTKGSSAAKGLHESFSGMLATLNKTGVLGPFGDALDGIDQALDKVSLHAKDIGPAMMGIGGALAGVGVGLSALGSKDQASHQQLQAAVAATGKSYDDYSEKIEAAIKHQEKFGDTANETQDALRILTTATNDPAKALQLLNTATDLAAAKHESLGEAATSLGKVYNGNTKLLKEFGITVQKTANYQKQITSDTTKAQSADLALAHAKRTLADIEEIDAGKKKLTVGQAIQLRNAEEAVRTAAAKSTLAHQTLNKAQDDAKKSAGNQTSAVDLLGNKLKGQASAAADTFGGKIQALRAHFDDSAAELGQKYGPALTAVGTGMAGVGAAITTAQGIMGTFTKASKDTEAAVKDVKTAEDGATAASDVLAGASGIGLVLLAIAALGIAAYAIYKNWNTIWNGMKLAVKVVWDWIKQNWPLLLGILLGPIALAAALIYKYRTQILQGIQAVWSWIKANWPLLLDILTGPIGLAVNYVRTHWSAITAAFQSVLNWFKSTWGTVTNAITSPIQSAWSWILSTIHTVVGWFAGIPWEIGQAFGGLASIIMSPFKTAFDAVARFWNSTVGSLSFKTPSWVPGLGGKGFSMPKIPVLDQGGLMTADGIIYAHAGEVISPAPAATRSGPAVVFSGAVFNQGVDVDTMMRRAAWIVRTQRV